MPKQNTVLPTSFTHEALATLLVAQAANFYNIVIDLLSFIIIVN